jgi:hypothetical protein
LWARKSELDVVNASRAAVKRLERAVADRDAYRLLVAVDELLACWGATQYRDWLTPALEDDNPGAD